MQASCLTARATGSWLLLLSLLTLQRLPMQLPINGCLYTGVSAGLHHAMLLRPDFDLCLDECRLICKLTRARPEQQHAGRCDNLKLRFQQKDLDTDEWETVDSLGQVSLPVRVHSPPDP